MIQSHSFTHEDSWYFPRNPIQIIYERGLEIRLESDGLWYFQSVRGQKVTADPSTIENIYGVHPIVTTVHVLSDVEGADYKDTFLVLPDGSLYELRLTDIHNELYGVGATYSERLIEQINNVIYTVEALSYHCRRLAECYSGICRDYADHVLSRLPDGSELEASGYGGYDEKPHYEFDALVTAARRSYDVMRYLLWNYFGSGGGSVPASFYRTLPLCTKLLPSLSSRLQQSWSQFGVKLTDYRDCIQHYVPIGPGSDSSHVQMTKLQGVAWSTSFYIPDNPEAKSKKHFRYTSSLDALTYGWQLATEVLGIVLLVFDAVLKEEQGQTE